MRLYKVFLLLLLLLKVGILKFDGINKKYVLMFVILWVSWRNFWVIVGFIYIFVCSCGWVFKLIMVGFFYIVGCRLLDSFS